MGFRGSLDPETSRVALERAAAARSPIELLDGVLAAWRSNHHPAIAELVDAAARRAVERAAPRVSAPTIAERQAQWLAIAGEHRAIDLAWLLEQFPVPRAELGLERIAAIAEWPDDPRVVVGLLELCRTKPLVSSRPLWRQIVRQLRERLEAHALPQLRELVATTERITKFDSWLCSGLGWLERASEQLAPQPAPNAATIERIAALVELKTERAGKQTIDELLREVWAAPSDDGPRHVLADWLAQRGDPRGELIMLQLARAGRTADRAAMRRERALLDEHGRSLLGPLESVVMANSLLAFERGFVVRCEVSWRRLAGQPHLMTHPAWSTVREYKIDPLSELPCETWLDSMFARGAKRI